MKTSSKNTHQLIRSSLLAATFAVLTIGASHASTILADVRGDYVGNHALPLADTYGTGTWDYYGSSHSDLSTKTELSWIAATGGHNAFYGTATDPNNIPAVASTSVFYDGATPAANQVAWHPGTADTDLQWVAGTGETGLLTLTGEFSRIGENAIHMPNDPTLGVVEFNIYVNGLSVYSATNIGTGPTATAPFSLTFSSAVGTTVDFVLSYAAGQSNPYYDESLLSAQIAVAAVPEPGTWAMMVGGLVLLGGLLRRKRA